MSETVGKRSSAVEAMVAASDKGRALMGGSDAMRAAGERYLPKFNSEDPADYQSRLKASWLFNGMRKTVKDMTGRVFDKSMELQDAPEQLKGWADNIDMQGRDLSVFASEVFKDSFIPGIGFIMVEAPRRDGETTRDQASVMGLRPYLVHLKVEDVLGWKTGLYGNALALSQFRIIEKLSEDDPKDEFCEESVEQVRVLDRMPGGVNVRLFRKNDKDKWTLYDEYPTEAPEITVVPFYAQRTGFFTGEPVLEDLADVNVAHWQSQSDQRNILHFARVPIMHISGRQNDQPLVISAGVAVQSSDPAARMEWVEHTGAAIGSGRQDLKDLEFQMEALGLQLLVESAQTATGSALDAAKETSTLAMMADNLKDAMEQALYFMAIYGGLGDGPITVDINKDFGLPPMTYNEMAALQKDVAMGLLSKETYLEERKRRGVLRADLNTQDELARIDSEGPDLGMDLGGPSSLESAMAALNG
jgi:hypothetical protein